MTHQLHEKKGGKNGEKRSTEKSKAGKAGEAGKACRKRGGRGGGSCWGGGGLGGCFLSGRCWLKVPLSVEGTVIGRARPITVSLPFFTALRRRSRVPLIGPSFLAPVLGPRSWPSFLVLPLGAPLWAPPFPTLPPLGFLFYLAKPPGAKKRQQ